MNISVRSVMGPLACLLASACASVQEEDLKLSGWVHLDSSTSGPRLSRSRMKSLHPSNPFTPPLDNKRCLLTHEEVRFERKFSNCITQPDKLLPNLMILKRTYACDLPGATGMRNKVIQSKVTLSDFSCPFSVVDSLGINSKEVVKENAEGSKFQGTLLDGKPSNIGGMIFADGRYNFDTWGSDLREGTGILIYGEDKDTLSYEGGWKLDQPNGIGTYKFGNGGVYKGEVTKNRFHGRGEYKAPDGTILKGTYSEGLRHGEFLRTEINGDQFKDVFAKDVLISSTKLN